jgi:hypothetical protein
VILGSVLLGIGIYADFPGSGYTPKLDHPLHWYCQTAVVLGAVTILMAILSYGLRAMSMLIRSKNAPPPASGPIAAPDPLPNSTGIKEMDGWN